MSEKVLETFYPQDFTDIEHMLETIQFLAKKTGHSHDTIHLESEYVFQLVEQELSDKSKVLNLRISTGEFKLGSPR